MDGLFFRDQLFENDFLSSAKTKVKIFFLEINFLNVIFLLFSAQNAFIGLMKFRVMALANLLATVMPANQTFLNKGEQRRIRSLVGS